MISREAGLGSGAGFSDCFYVLGTGLGWAGLACLGWAVLWLGWVFGFCVFGVGFPTAFVFWEPGLGLGRRFEGV